MKIYHFSPFVLLALFTCCNTAQPEKANAPTTVVVERDPQPITEFKQDSAMKAAILAYFPEIKSAIDTCHIVDCPIPPGTIVGLFADGKTGDRTISVKSRKDLPYLGTAIFVNAVKNQIQIYAYYGGNGQRCRIVNSVNGTYYGVKYLTFPVMFLEL